MELVWEGETTQELSWVSLRVRLKNERVAKHPITMRAGSSRLSDPAYRGCLWDEPRASVEDL